MRYNVNFKIDFKRHNYPGKLVVLEGNEGSGKTTQAGMLAKSLKEKGLKVFETKEPTQNVVGQLIYKVLDNELKIPPAALQYLFSADRAIHQNEIEQHLKNGEYVIMDRYFWSAVAYGIADMDGREDTELAALSVLSFYNQFIAADFTFYLDVDVEKAVERIKASARHTHIYDKKGMMEKVDVTYKKLIKRFPGEFVVVDGNKSKDEVLADLLKNIK